MTKRDPKVTDRCAQCGKGKQIKKRSGIDPAMYVDPFCSNVCARTWHGVPVPGGISERDGKHLGRPRDPMIHQP